MMSNYSLVQTKTESKKGKSSSIIRLSHLYCFDWAIIPVALFLKVCIPCSAMSYYFDTLK